jgi:glutaredoxin 3
MDEPKAKIVIYGAEWCPPCHIAKDYLKSQHIEYEYINIDENRQAGMDIAAKTGWNAIPIINIGEEYMLGFDRVKLDSALRAHKLLK